MKTITHERKNMQDSEGVFQERGWYFPKVIILLFEEHKIDAMDLVLLGRINALCSSDQGCWASNEYFQGWLELSRRAITRRISNLQRLGLLRVEVEQLGVNRGARRRIYVMFQGDGVVPAANGPNKRSYSCRKRPVYSTVVLLRKTTQAGRAEASACGLGFFNLEEKEKIKVKHPRASARLVKTFYIYLVKHRLHLNRSDLPRNNPKKKKHTLHSWIQAASVLIDQAGDIQYIYRVMKWYFEHRRNIYLSDIRSMTTFVEKFFRVEKVMLREEGQREVSPQITIEKVS